MKLLRESNTPQHRTASTQQKLRYTPLYSTLIASNKIGVIASPWSLCILIRSIGSVRASSQVFLLLFCDASTEYNKKPVWRVLPAYLNFKWKLRLAAQRTDHLLCASWVWLMTSQFLLLWIEQNLVGTAMCLLDKYEECRL